MTERLLIAYTALAALATAALLAALCISELRARRRSGRDTVLRSRYLRILMLYLLSGAGPVPRFPMIRRAGARRLLAETVAGLTGVTCGLDAAPLRRVVAAYGLDRWLLGRIRLASGCRRARGLMLLARLPLDEAVAARAARYVRSRNRWVRFQALMVQLSADPSTALRLMAEYPAPFSACEVGEILILLRRGMLPIAYGPLVESPCRNLRIVAGDDAPELGREALYTLCTLRRPLTRRRVGRRLTAMSPAERKALMRYMAAEGYSPGLLRRLFDARERSYCESLVQSYKRSLA